MLGLFNPVEFSEKCYIGIDIGKNGGIAIMNKGTLTYKKIPVLKKEVNTSEIIEIFNGLKNTDCHVCMEDLHSIYNSSAKSNYQFGWINGLIEAILICYKIPFTKVIPVRWQKEMWEGVRLVKKMEKDKKTGEMKEKTDTKATSLLAAKRLFPHESFLASSRSSVPHDGIVDAVLLAEYARRKNY